MTRRELVFLSFLTVATLMWTAWCIYRDSLMLAAL